MSCSCLSRGCQGFQTTANSSIGYLITCGWCFSGHSKQLTTNKLTCYSRLPLLITDACFKIFWNLCVSWEVHTQGLLDEFQPALFIESFLQLSLPVFILLCFLLLIHDKCFTTDACLPSHGGIVLSCMAQPGESYSIQGLAANSTSTWIFQAPNLH